MPTYIQNSYVLFQHPTDSSKQLMLRDDGSIEIARSDHAAHIDFKSSNAEDYDARIIHQNNGFQMTSGVGVQTGTLTLTAEGYPLHNRNPSFDEAHRGYSGGFPQTNTLYYNKNSCYNTSTARFTAPSDGYYQFYMTCIKTSGSNVTRLYLKVNGTTMYGNRHFRATEGVTYSTNGVGMWTVWMSKGDYAQSYLGAGSVYSGSNEYNYFGGEMIG
jgi:hypothetical protein